MVRGGRIAGKLGASLLAAGLLVASAATPAVAQRRDRITVSLGHPVKRDYPPLPDNDPTLANSYTPGFCDSAPGCDTIPLTIVIPKNLDPNEDYFGRISLTWDDTPAHSNVFMYLWDDPAGTQQIAQATSGSQPERILLYRPDKKKYLLVVHNPAGDNPSTTTVRVSGPNLAYHLKVEVTTDSFTSPFESLEGPPPIEQTSSPDASGLPAPVVPTAASASEGFPVAPVALDSTLGGLSGRSGELAAALRAPSFGGSTQALASFPPPKPVRGIVVLIWAGIVPLLVVGGSAFAIWRRAARVLKVD